LFESSTPQVKAPVIGWKLVSTERNLRPSPGSGSGGGSGGFTGFLKAVDKGISVGVGWSEQLARKRKTKGREKNLNQRMSYLRV
jgi:hypothetical protein